MSLLQQLFESTNELPAEFASKVETIFEAALVEKVDAKVAEEVTKLQESYERKLEESKEAFVTEAMAVIDTLVEEAILEWAKENAVGLDTEIKGQLAESFLVGMKDLFAKADIEITNEGVAAKQIAELNDSLAEAKKAVAEAKAALNESTTKLVEFKRTEIIAEATKDLADTVAHRAKRLCEAFEFTTEEDFRAKTAMIVEAVSGITEKKVTGTVDADGVHIPVDGGKAPIDQANTESGVSPAEEIVTTVHKKPELDQHKGAEGLKEAYETAKASAAPHHGEDLVAATLALMGSKSTKK